MTDKDSNDVGLGQLQMKVSQYFYACTLLVKLAANQYIIL